jgi:hypothetical protein
MRRGMSMRRDGVTAVLRFAHEDTVGIRRKLHLLYSSLQDLAIVAEGAKLTNISR